MKRVAAALVIFALAKPAIVGVLDDDSYSIMKEEPAPPGVLKPQKSPRHMKRHVVIPRRAPDEPRRIPQMPPPIINSQTGQAYPNLPPPVPGAGIGGGESGQDRAMRCAHQTGVYGQADTNYLGACINQ
jgi:hypothetical protein